MCEPLRFQDGTVAIICGGRRGRRSPPCAYCGKPSAFECDGPSSSRKSGTCDVKLCGSCRVHVPPDLDFCRAHRAEAAACAAQLRLFA